MVFTELIILITTIIRSSEVTGKTAIDLLGSTEESFPPRNGKNIEEGS